MLTWKTCTYQPQTSSMTWAQENTLLLIDRKETCYKELIHWAFFNTMQWLYWPPYTYLALPYKNCWILLKRWWFSKTRNRCSLSVAAVLTINFRTIISRNDGPADSPGQYHEWTWSPFDTQPEKIWQKGVSELQRAQPCVSPPSNKWLLLFY